MKNKVSKIFYIIRLILFILHILMIFMILNSIVGIGIIGYLFLMIDIIFIIRNTIELLSKKKHYQEDIYYSIMQCGVYGYIAVLWSRIYWHSMIFSPSMVRYLQINYIILSVLMIFLMMYSIFLIDKKNKDL